MANLAINTEQPLLFTDTILTKRRESSSVPFDLQVLDLFCGAGGLAEGFRMAGFQSILGLDCWNPACSTFADNHPTASVVCNSIENVTNEFILETANIDIGSIGIICGGPPCQGFSLAGKRLSDDPRNFLYKYFLRAVETLLPKWVVIENVPSLLQNTGVVSALRNDFDALVTPKAFRYELQHVVVNAADYGVPQTRTRVLIVAKRTDVIGAKKFDLKKAMEPMFVESIDQFNLLCLPSYITFDEATSDLPIVYAGEEAEEMAYDKLPETSYQQLMRGLISIGDFFKNKGLAVPRYQSPIRKSQLVFNHKPQNHSELLIERFKHIPPGGSKEDLRKIRPDLVPTGGHPEQGLTYGRLSPDKPAPTIPANYSRPSGNRSIHPHLPRLITPREAMRLSSFSDSYRLDGLMVAQREQVGNSVPPLLAYHLACKIREFTG